MGKKDKNESSADKLDKMLDAWKKDIDSEPVNDKVLDPRKKDD